MINDFDNGCETTGVGSVHEENNAPDFYQPPLCRFDLDLCHRIAVCNEVSRELDTGEGFG